MGKYPRLGQDRRRPNPETEGSPNVGKPCIVCGTWTMGIKEIQVDIFRGNDEQVRVCADHWKRSAPQIIACYLDSIVSE